MTAKVAKKEARTAMPKAPPVVYVEIGEFGDALAVSELPNEAEDERDEGNRLARYKFDCFVAVGYEAVVTDVSE